jgi:small-conductance mechanosensitive channel
MVGILCSESISETERIRYIVTNSSSMVIGYFILGAAVAAVTAGSIQLELLVNLLLTGLFAGFISGTILWASRQVSVNH